jgi:ABC-2 type transport system ATP-binding protein
MALTAEHFVVIGRGRLIADVSGDELATMARDETVRVRSPQAAELRDLLAADATDIAIRGADLLEVSGMDAEEIGTRAWTANLCLLELTPQRASLEDIFMDLTSDAVDYHGLTSAVADEPHLEEVS